jgi:hypothetical protein
LTQQDIRPGTDWALSVLERIGLYPSWNGLALYIPAAVIR